MTIRQSELHPSLPLQGSSAIVLLQAAHAPDIAAIEEALRREVDPAASVMPAGASGDGWVIEAGGHHHVGFHVEKPVPAEDFSRLLAGVPQDHPLHAIVAGHRSHVVLSALGTAGSLAEAAERALLLTRIAAALPSTCGPTGFYWLPSRRLVPLDLARAIAAQSGDGIEALRSGGTNVASRLPVAFWTSVGLALVDGDVTGQTEGLACFTGHELAMTCAGRAPGDVLDMLAGLVSYLFDSRAVFAPGHQLQMAGETFTLVLRPAGEGVTSVITLIAIS